MISLSPNMTLKEATFSTTAIKNGISNTPNNEQIERMKLLLEKVYEPLCLQFGKKISFNSFFRSDELNKKLKGAKNSQHVTGEAIDLDDTRGGYTNKQLFNYILNNLEFSQLIWEFGNDNNPDWVHVSYKKNGNKKQVLRAIKKEGKTNYIKWR